MFSEADASARLKGLEELGIIKDTDKTGGTKYELLGDIHPVSELFSKEILQRTNLESTRATYLEILRKERDQKKGGCYLFRIEHDSSINAL